MDTDFDDIKIVSLEDELTAESPDNPALRYIYLKLSQVPPPLWQKHFNDSRKIARHGRWRRMWVDRRYIVVECVPDELETHHLIDLKKDLAFANGRYREYVDVQARIDARQHETQLLERARIRDIKDRLNFD